MKAMRLMLKVGGAVLLLIGAAFLIVGYFDAIRVRLPFCKTHTEFDDYADLSTD